MAKSIAYYDKATMLDSVLMTVACALGDHIALNSSGNGILADATDMVKQSVGIASRDVSSADVTAGGNRARVSLYPDCDVEGFTSLNPSTGRRYLAVAGASGSTDTTTAPSTVGGVHQLVGGAITTTKVRYRIRLSNQKYQAAATTTIILG